MRDKLNALAVIPRNTKTSGSLGMPVYQITPLAAWLKAVVKLHFCIKSLSWLHTSMLSASADRQRELHLSANFCMLRQHCHCTGEGP